MSPSRKRAPAGATTSHIGLLLSLASVFGCAGAPVTESVGSSSSALTADGGALLPPEIGKFALLATGAITLGDRDKVAIGDVGTALPSGNPFTLTVGHDAQIAGDLFGSATNLLDRANVGNVSAGQITAPFAKFKSLSPFAALPAPPAAGPFSSGSAAVTVGSGATRVLAPGAYAAVVVQGALRLAGGEYDIASLTLGPDASVTALAASVLRIAGALSASDRVSFAVAAGLGAGDLRIAVGGTGANAVSLGNDDHVTAVLLVPAGTFRTADRLTLTGAAAAQAIVLGNDAVVNLAIGFGCSTNATCNDANTCTQDLCSAGFCAHQAAANGVACGGDACTQAGTCQAGACAGSKPIVCAAADSCHAAGTCDPATGQCSNPTAADGTACSDGNACTLFDSCRAGVCTPAFPVLCIPTDDCQSQSGTCDPGTGQCSNAVFPDGTPGSKGVCQGGTCTTPPLTIRYHQVGACDEFVDFFDSDSVTAVAPQSSLVVFGIDSIDNASTGQSFAFHPNQLFVQQPATRDFEDVTLFSSNGPDILGNNAIGPVTVAVGQNQVFTPPQFGVVLVSTQTDVGVVEASQTAYVLQYAASPGDPQVTMVKTNAGQTSFPLTGGLQADFVPLGHIKDQSFTERAPAMSTGALFVVRRRKDAAGDPRPSA